MLPGGQGLSLCFNVGARINRGWRKISKNLLHVSLALGVREVAGGEVTERWVGFEEVLFELDVTLLEGIVEIDEPVKYSKYEKEIRKRRREGMNRR